MTHNHNDGPKGPFATTRHYYFDPQVQARMEALERRLAGQRKDRRTMPTPEQGEPKQMPAILNREQRPAAAQAKPPSRISLAAAT